MQAPRPATLRWTVVIPVKSLPAAKSRLVSASVDAAAHRRLVEAIRTDTIAAARLADGVARVLLVTDSPAASPAASPASDESIAQVRPGLNGALRDGADHAAAHWPEDGIAALVGDLPALRPEELARALAAAAESGGGFVPDSDGTGTTLLAGVPGATLLPRFGEGSAARHGEITHALDAGPGLRRDVDTADDLARAASEVGVGPATSAVLADTSFTADTAAAGAERSPSVGMICR